VGGQAGGSAWVRWVECHKLPSAFHPSTTAPTCTHPPTAIPTAADPAPVAAQHPRLETLKARYDARDYVIAGTGSGAAAQHGSALASALCELTLQHGRRSVRKKLPSSTTVGAVKLLCERLFRVKAGRQVLVLGAGGEGGGGGEQDIGGDDTKPLSFWEPRVGCVCMFWERGGEEGREHTWFAQSTGKERFLPLNVHTSLFAATPCNAALHTGRGRAARHRGREQQRGGQGGGGGSRAGGEDG